MDITLIIGPMFSGKSSELLRFMKNAKSIDLNVLIINHDFDTRTGESIETHDGSKANALKTNTLANIDISKYDVIGIDEAQFFNDIKEFVQKNEHLCKKLYIAGLDGDYQRKPFGQILDIIPYCQNVKKLHSMCSICKNGTKGSFTKRTINSSALICVGAQETHISVCRKHF